MTLNALDMQSLLVILIVAASASYLLVQLRSALMGRRSKIGSCCAKGCDTPSTSKAAGRAFIPSDLLIRRK